MPLIRINKFLSQCGIASRRKSDELIARGAVSLNGKTLLAPGVLIDTDKDIVAVKGKQLELSKSRSYSYYLLNKPRGFITTASDTHGRRTVFDILPKLKGFFPVGRLDKDTSGLLLVTNDGDLAHRLMHPSFEIRKRYLVKIKSDISQNDIKSLEKGVDIGDECLSVLKVHKIKHDGGSTELVLELHEGRNRQIRRTFDALGYKVSELTRVVYAGLRLNMKEGEFKKLANKEISYLKKKVGLS